MEPGAGPWPRPTRPYRPGEAPAVATVESVQRPGASWPSWRPRFDLTGIVAKHPAQPMAVAGNERKRPFDERPDHRQGGQERQRPKDGDLLSDPSPGGAPDAPSAVLVPYMVASSRTSRGGTPAISPAAWSGTRCRRPARSSRRNSRADREQMPQWES